MIRKSIISLVHSSDGERAKCPRREKGGKNNLRTKELTKKSFLSVRRRNREEKRKKGGDPFYRRKSNCPHTSLSLPPFNFLRHPTTSLFLHAVWDEGRKECEIRECCVEPFPPPSPMICCWLCCCLRRRRPQSKGAFLCRLAASATLFLSPPPSSVYTRGFWVSLLLSPGGAFLSKSLCCS